MKLSGNTIFVTGGGSGIIAGRRRSRLDAMIAANPGMDAVQLDITDPTSIDQVAARLIAKTSRPQCPGQQCRHYATR
jgi:uncharacterized oxidoreductase